MKTTLFIFLLFFMISCDEKPKPAVIVEKPVIVSIGKIFKIKGIVLRNETVAKEGDELFEKDVIETKEKSFARLDMNDSTKINIGAKSKIVLKEYNLKDMDNRIVDVNLIIGKIRTHFRKRLLPESKGSLKVTTRMASFGVRGTEFITENSNLGKTKMFLLEGKVILTKTKKDSEEKQEIEVKPLEIVSFSEETEVVETKVVPEEAVAEMLQDETMNMDIQKIEESIPLPAEPKADEAPKSTSTDSAVRNFLFSLEHGSKALPWKNNGKIVYFNDTLSQQGLAKNKKGEIVSVDPTSDKGEKIYKVPVIDEKGKKLYVLVSEQYLQSLMSQTKDLGTKVIDHTNTENYSRQRLPASFGP